MSQSKSKSKAKSPKSNGLGVTLFCCVRCVKILFWNLDCDKVESNSSSVSFFSLHHVAAAVSE